MRSPVIIVGAPRSGTSMMMSTMRHILKYAGHNEGHFFTLLNSLLSTTEHHYQPLGDNFRRKTDVLLLDEKINLTDDLKRLFKGYIMNIYGEKPWFLKTPLPNFLD